MARLREAIAAVPSAGRYVIHAEQGSPFPSWGGSGRGSSVTAYGRPVSDTCKEVVDGLVRRTVPRDSLVTITGPWVFTREALTDGLRRIEGRDRDVTGLLEFSESAGLKVRVVLSA